MAISQRAQDSVRIESQMLPANTSIGAASTSTDYAQAQRQHQSWVSEVRSTIQRYKNGAAPEVLIRKVPEYLRLPQEKFTPKEWRFGLHNRELHTSGTERLKISVAGYFFARLESDAWDNFCNVVVDDPARFVRLYGLQDGFTEFSETQVKYLLALDALFLAKRGFQFQGRLCMDLHWYGICLLTDMVLLENQVPMDLLRKVAEYKLIDYYSLDRVRNSTVNWICPLSLNTSQNPDGVQYPDLVNCSHFLDCLHKMMCGPDPPEAKGRYVPIESAVNLMLAGIKIKGVPGTLTKVSFQGGCLSLPIIKIFDRFETVFRNLSVYEYYSLQPGSHCTISGYRLLMGNLIGNLDDVKLLIKHGVIISYVGPETADMSVRDEIRVLVDVRLLRFKMGQYEK
ncbi:unnamed protein product [Sphagnum jensenii]|uniref:Uncharacterized protein n=1 Tax=Sphagnum jensenii TaxID=128206 RepID=A0ABP1BB19_9BRYO